MRTVTIVTKAHTWGKDETQELQLLDENDVKELIRISIAGDRQEIEKQADAFAELQEQVADMERKQQELCEKVSQLQKGVDVAKTALDSRFQQNFERIEQNFKSLQEKLCQEFIQQCRSDVETYFLQLSNYTKKLTQEAAEIKATQSNISEQLALSAVITQFFCDQYKADLQQKEQQLKGEAQRISILQEQLAKIDKNIVQK